MGRNTKSASLTLSTTAAAGRWVVRCGGVQSFGSPLGEEADTDCTAMPGQPTAGPRQASDTRHPSKIQLTHVLRIGVIQVLIWIEQILHYDLSQKAEKRCRMWQESANK